MVMATRSRAKAAAAQQKRTTSQRAFKRSYKDLTPAQQSISRHNRFLERVWKVPRAERAQCTKCVACLGDFFDHGSGYFGIMACDHPIHLDCLIRHADAYLDRLGFPRLEDMDDDAPEADLEAVFTERTAMSALGAPCPACRLQFPMRHMSVFQCGA